MVGKMVPKALPVYIIKVRSLDTSGRHVWEELRNGVCKEGLAYLEWAGRVKEDCKSRRKKMQVTLLGTEPGSENLQLELLCSCLSQLTSG